MSCNIQTECTYRFRTSDSYSKTVNAQNCAGANVNMGLWNNKK